MSNKTLYFLVGILLICFSSLYAQSSSDLLQTVIPPSPEATSMAKFIETPVSHYTGLPNISIPIYAIPLDGVSIPIGLSYHAKGVRVEEIASRVGLGWALNSGGSITRQIRGFADDGADITHEYLNHNLFETYFEDTQVGQQTRQQLYNLDASRQIDLFPDQFSFNFMGYSGKFIFDQRTKLPVMQKFSDLTIEPIWENGPGSTINAWIITTPTGFQGYFGISKDGLREARDKEVVLTSYVYTAGSGLASSGGSSITPISSWYLLDIISPQGNSVTYTYQQEEPTYLRRSYDQLNTGTSVLSSHFSKVKPLQNQIQSISFDEGEVLFIPQSTEREDLNNAYALDRIEIRNQDHSLNQEFVFDYHYTSSPADNNVLAQLHSLDLTLGDKASKRLFLKSMSTYGTTNASSIPPYQFHYSGFDYAGNHTTLLPHRFSNSQDYWGYFNGKNNGQFLTFLDYGTSSIDRSVDTLKVQTGTLTRIDYPTGGSVTYEYEHNKAIPPSYFQDLFFPNTNSLTTQNFGMFKDPSQYNGSYYESGSFTVGTNPVVGFITSTIWITPNDGCSTTQQTSTCQYNISLHDQHQNVTLLTIGTNTFNLPPGNYTMRVTPKNAITEDPSDFENTNFNISLRWDEQVADQNELLFTSGNRLKKIVLADGNGQPITKEYEYVHESGLSSGKIFSLPQYYHIDRDFGFPVFDQLYGARPGSPLTYEQGNHEGYSYVVEYGLDENNERLHKTTYEFTTVKDGGEFYKTPYTLATDNEWLRGKPLCIKYFKKESNGYSLLKSIVNEYWYADISVSPTVFNQYPIDVGTTRSYQHTRTLYDMHLAVAKYDPSNPGNPDSYKTYYLTGGTADLRQTIETDYTDNGTIVKVTDYSNKYDVHYQPFETKTTNSDGKTHSTETYYVADFDSGLSPVVAELKNRHMIAIPIEVISKLNGDVIGGNFTEYGIYENGQWGNQATANSLLLPLRIHQISLNGPFSYSAAGSFPPANGAYEPRVEFSSYDDHGNLMQQYKTGDPAKTYYIWGYNYAVPVAQIVGANISFSDINNLQNQINDQSLTGEALVSALTSLREQSKTFVTTYTYNKRLQVATITDPNGFTATYEYDGLGRLIQMVDQKGNTVQENEYNYKLDTN